MIDSNVALIRALTTLGSVVIAAIVALAVFGSANNPQVNSAITTIATIVTVLIAGMLSLKGSSDAKTEATKSKDASRQNTAALAVVTEKVTKAVDGVDGIHTIVNGQKTAMEKRLDDQNRQILDLHTAISRLETALTREREKPPGVAPSAGTPAAGTSVVESATIDVTGTATIVMPPETIVKDGKLP